MCSWESSTCTFSASYYRETTFLTRVRLAFLLTCALRYRHEKVHYRTSWVRPRSNSVECEKLRVRKERTKGTWTVRRKRDAGTTLCRALLRNTDVPRDTFPRRESLGVVCYYFQCGSLLVCRWASTSGAANPVSDSSTVTTFGYLRVWSVGIQYYFWRVGLRGWLWASATTSRATAPRLTQGVRYYCRRSHSCARLMSKKTRKEYLYYTF